MNTRPSIYCCLIPLLAGCAVDQPYLKPELQFPSQWAEHAEIDGVWHPATPADASPKGEWWRIFGDEELNQLEQQALAGNLSLQAAAARLAQARTLIQAARAELVPNIDLGGSVSRSRASANRPNSNSNNAAAPVQNDYAVNLAVNYEADLFGRVKFDIESQLANAQQAAADLENTRLLLTADIAIHYFSLRALDGEIAIVEKNITLQNNVLDIMRARHDNGVANGIDLAQQELLVGNTRTQSQLLLRQRAQRRHALVTLLGLETSRFQWNTRLLSAQLPKIPLVLPAEILQRRPDIASAERAVAAANAQIGVARAARFPRVDISMAEGVESRYFNTLFDAPSLAWSLGIAFTQTIFDGGRNKAKIDYADAVYQQTVIHYRQAVLNAWQEVEDGLSSSRTLAIAYANALTADRAAGRSAEITEQRYQAGLASALERYTAQQNALTAQRQTQQLAGEQWVNAVYLIKALGGGWERASLY